MIFDNAWLQLELGLIFPKQERCLDSPKLNLHQKFKENEQLHYIFKLSGYGGGYGKNDSNLLH